MKPKSMYETFLEEHLPKVPAATFEGGFTLAPAVKPTSERDLIDFYFNNDVRQLQHDMQARPAHYSADEKEIVEAMSRKRPLPHGTTKQDLNNIVLKFCEKTKAREKREKVIRRAQDAMDPAVARAIEKQRAADERDRSLATFEDQKFLKSIKII